MATVMAMARDLPADSLTYLIFPPPLAAVTHGCPRTRRRIPSVALISRYALLLYFSPLKPHGVGKNSINY